MLVHQSNLPSHASTPRSSSVCARRRDRAFVMACGATCATNGVTCASGLSKDAVHLDSGCSGNMTLHVTTGSDDGIKVHEGAHDLTVNGSVTCNGRDGTVHQDGIQAMGGQRVTFNIFVVAWAT